MNFPWSAYRTPIIDSRSGAERALPPSATLLARAVIAAVIGIVAGGSRRAGFFGSFLRIGGRVIRPGNDRDIIGQLLLGFRLRCGLGGCLAALLV